MADKELLEAHHVVEANRELRMAAIRSLQMDVEATRSRMDMIKNELDTISGKLVALLEAEEAHK